MTGLWKKLIANIYIALQLYQSLVYFSLFPPHSNKNWRQKWKEEAVAFGKIHSPKHFYTFTKTTKSSQNASATFDPCRRAVQQRLWWVEQTKQKGGVFLSATSVRGRRIDAGGTCADARVFRQQTCFWSWSRSLWLCLRATGTRWSLLVERLISPYKLA